MKHIGFTGTRKGMTPSQVSSVDNIIWNLVGDYTLHHGDCIGADADMHRLCRKAGFEVHIHPPNSNRYRAFCDYDMRSDPRPYIVRNHDIIDASDFVIATPCDFEEQLRSGTWATIRYARDYKPLTIVYPDGSTG